ncbi:SpoIIE family protein phosphatase [bacterium]|nr:SpoIIE family protein phosphatase [bacterium]
MQPKAIKTIINAIGLLLLAYVFVFFSWEGSKLARWSMSGQIDSEIESTDGVSWVFTEIDSSDFAGVFIPAEGDTLIAINDTLTSYDQIDGFITQIYDPGERFKTTYRRFGRERSAVAVAKPVTVSRALPFYILQVLRLLIILSFIGVGLWAFQKRSDSAGVRALALFSFAVAAFMLSSVNVLSSRYASFQIPSRTVIEYTLRTIWAFVGGLWLSLQLLFPKRSSFFRRTKGYSYLIILFPQIILGIFAITDQFELTHAFSPLLAILTTAQFTVGFALLARHYVQSHNVLQRRQTRLVLYGSAIGLIALTSLLFIGAFFGGWFAELSLATQLAMINGAFLALLLTPVSLAYAFGKYRLLEVEGKLRRGTRHLLITTVLLALFFVVIYMVGELLIRNLGITSRTPILVIAMLLGLGISPLQRRLQELLERRFYPERYQLRVMIEDFSQRMGSFPDRETLYLQLEARLREAVGVERIVAVLANPNGEFLSHDGTETPFRKDSDVIQMMIRTGRPILMDEAMASLRVPFSDGQIMWIRQRRVNLLMPMFARLNLIGFLALGRTTRGTDYTPEVIEVLAGLISQVALSSENLRLLEDNLEKRRLEEQLQMARDIQEGFLPRVIPTTPGIQIAAKSRFSLEVAGDYYDVIGLKDGKTVIAVGDVSGKGAGAALIMANLQASLRTAVKVGVDLGEVVGEINDLIHQNTPIEQYITFFVGVFDPDNGVMTYVNAGHNPPMLFRNGGEIEELSVGGMILGAMPGMPYEQGAVTLDEKDRFLLYTDGASEAANARDEEFGEDRIRDIVLAMDEAAPKEVVDQIERKVMEFHGNRELEDDCTLLMVCRCANGATPA